MGAPDLITLVAQTGLAVALVLFLTWQGSLREARMEERERMAAEFLNSRLLARLDEALGRQREIVDRLNRIEAEAIRAREALDRLTQRQPVDHP